MIKPPSSTKENPQDVDGTVSDLDADVNVSYIE
jgi:hypothetical protein